jgi:uncharacterized protein YegJ (DUF2314 family)
MGNHGRELVRDQQLVQYGYSTRIGFNMKRYSSLSTDEKIWLWVFFLAGGLTLYTCLTSDKALSWRFYPLPVSSLIASIAIWAQSRWARSMGMVALLIMIIETGIGGVSVWRVLGVGCLLLSLRSFWHELRPGAERATEESQQRSQPAQTPMISMVALLKSPLTVTAEDLATAASHAWKTPVGTTDDAGSFAVSVDALSSIKVGNELFLVHHPARSYFNDPSDAAQHIPELRCRQAVLDHAAWASVDFLAGSNNVSVSETERLHLLQRVCSLLGELISDDNCLALLDPATGRIVPFQPELREILRSDAPVLKLFQPRQVPVLSVSDDDAAMTPAVEQARRSWPEFVTAFETRDDNQTFAIKAAFHDGDAGEFMWLSVTAIENDVILGQLDNEPVFVKNVKCGDRVRVTLEQLNDWVYLTKDGTRGAFTVDVLSRKHSTPPNG